MFDLTDIPAQTEATGLHWPTSQATSIQNCIFKMSEAVGNNHLGLFVESGKLSPVGYSYTSFIATHTL